MKYLRWASLRGMNLRDVPQALPDDMGVLVQNVELLGDGGIGRRRPSCTSYSLSGPTNAVRWFFQHGTELWVFYGGTTIAAARQVSSGTWSTPSMSDTVSGLGIHAASFNSKLFLAYNSDQNRLHAWDPQAAAIRRVGILASAAPTVADGGGAGGYAATARYYRVAWRIKSGSTVLATSELSPAVSFTPSGGNANATITKPTTPDSATHWVLYGLIGTAGDTYDLYEELAETVVATTTVADTTAPASYSGDAPMQLGLNIPPPSCKYLLATDNRILMAGVYESSGASDETAPVDDRVYFTRVLGSSDQGDDESIPNTVDQKNWIDVGRNDGGTITALAGPIDGIVYVFKERSIWRLIPTGIDTAPYRSEVVSRNIGAPQISDSHIPQYTTIAAEDDAGQPVLYFVALAGGYRLSPAYGTEFVGWDIGDRLTGSGFQDGVVWGAAWISARRQVWWVESTTIWVFTPSLAQRTPQGVRGGWAKYTLGHLFTQALAVADLAGGNITSVTPLVGGYIDPTTPLVYYFAGNATTDGGAAFTAQVTSKPYLLGDGTHRVTVNPPVLEAKTEASATPSVAYVLDHGRETRSATAPALTAAGSETRKAVVVEGLEGSDAQAVQVTVTWDSDHTETIDAVSVPYRVQEPL